MLTQHRQRRPFQAMSSGQVYQMTQLLVALSKSTEPACTTWTKRPCRSDWEVDLEARWEETWSLQQKLLKHPYPPNHNRQVSKWKRNYEQTVHCDPDMQQTWICIEAFPFLAPLGSAQRLESKSKVASTLWSQESFCRRYHVRDLLPARAAL